MSKTFPYTSVEKARAQVKRGRRTVTVRRFDIQSPRIARVGMTLREALKLMEGPNVRPYRWNGIPRQGGQ